MTVYESKVDFPLIARGKVRDIYTLDDSRLLLVASDRLSAFDVVFPDPIPGKGKVLNKLAEFWFRNTADLVENHMITTDVATLNLDDATCAQLMGRSMIARRCKVFPVECVVRGYLEGSAWKDYQTSGEVSGVKLPPGMKRREKFPEPIFTPSTKADAGHDEPISFDQVVSIIGEAHAHALRDLSIKLYSHAHDLLLSRQIVLADTKFEFGLLEDRIILVDEALTPDSSRFFEADTFHTESPRSYDKQYVRDYVEQIGWDKKPPAPNLPDEIIAGTSGRYQKIYEIITNEKWND